MIRFAFSAMILAAAGLSQAAHADVMEISSSGQNWVAGGPAAVAGQAAIPKPARENAHDVALTTISADAGPARFRERIGQLAAKYDISPALLEAVVWQESRWNTGALSPAGARGLSQLMPGTARQMGVNPDDPHANLEGGARYLRIQLDTFGGDIEKALAAYNAGPGAVIKARGVPAIAETRAYVAAIMARLSIPVRK